MLRRIVLVLILLPLSLGVIALAVANRHAVQLVLDPFAGEGGLALAVPLFVVVFTALILGVLLGGSAVWFRQGRYRRAAREAGREARRAVVQVEQLKSEQMRAEQRFGSPGRTALPAPDRRSAA